jgi:type IV pilus assembly protein PilY1
MVTAVFATTNTWAGDIVLANAPLVTGLSKTVAPNVLFILDDSGSMDYEYMPDDVNSNRTRNCYRNYGYNTIYFNPAAEYPPPVDANGTPYANANFNAARRNGFDAGSTTDNLSASTTSTDTVTTTGGPATLARNPITPVNGTRTFTVAHTAHGLHNDDRVRFGAALTVSRLTIPANTWLTISNVTTNSYQITLTRQQSRDTANSNTAGGGNGVTVRWEMSTTTTTTTYTYYYTVYAPGGVPATPPNTCEDNANYVRIHPANPTEATAAERQKFANWYTYYRTRLLLMKTGAGRAFSTVTGDYRVGFTVISDKGTAYDFLGVDRFNPAHKASWYSTLYGVTADGYTPLRGALSKAGRYYAGKLVSGDKDPVQYSCQKNFTILTTDGYWNTNDEATNYGPFQMDNATRVGNQDGGESRPYADTYSNTLADVAMYYYKTDLRPNAGTGGLTDEGEHLDVSENNVPDTTTDAAKHQHMVTFTLGLGMDGTLRNPADFPALVQGTKQWPDAITNSDEERVDDLWHAAVNGRGKYLSAKNATAVEETLHEALESISYIIGSSSAAATSNLQPVAGDNTAFIAQFETGHWVGNLLARSIDVATGAISTSNIWSAQAKLDTQVSAADDTRSIYTFDGSTPSKLKAFTVANLTTEIGAKYFKSDATNPRGKLSQYDSWTATQKSTATDTAMITYLRGRTAYEDSGADPALGTDLFRDRLHTLGDIASAAPVYVRKPPFAYSDSGYAAYTSSNALRLPNVYVGANDGMLHAFDGTPSAAGGTERWAYIPSMMLPNLYKLADDAYATNHRFYVDGPIVVGDAKSSTGWATILVGGLGHGGRGYYALDVTDPASPKALWEFGTNQDADIGYSYGNPVITKRASDGRWVVLLTSGYNNTSPGDGKGRLYVIDAFSGAKLNEIITDDGNTDPNLSGIAKVSNYVEEGLTNNSTQYVYGGDLDGALWRFDTNDGSRVLLANTSATRGEQPITVQPELARIRDGAGTWHRVVYFGTGRALGPNDLTSATDNPSYGKAQGIYAVKDTGSYVGVLTVTTTSKLVSQTLDTTTDPRRIDPIKAVDWQLNNGWFVTVPNNERFTVDPGLQLGTLVIAANIAEQGYCKPTGSSVLYQLNYKDGNVLTTSEYEAQIVGTTQLQLTTGSVVIDPVFADGSTGNTPQPTPPGGAGGATRVSWREIE